MKRMNNIFCFVNTGISFPPIPFLANTGHGHGSLSPNLCEQWKPPTFCNQIQERNSKYFLCIYGDLSGN